MPTFDVVSELDLQEVRNAVDQADREVSTRFDFKNTDSTVALADTKITLESSTEDRLAALRLVLEHEGGQQPDHLVRGDVDEQAGGDADGGQAEDGDGQDGGLGRKMPRGRGVAHPVPPARIEQPGEGR